MKKLFSFVCVFLFLITLQAQEFGVASYYADAFHGRKTANGETYDKNAYTAAHKELEFGTIIKVTRLDNNKSVQLRVNDRGPFISGRVVELSKVAAEKIGLIRDGIAEVRVDVIGKKEKEEVVQVKVEKAPVIPKDIPTSASTETAKPVKTVPSSVKIVKEAKSLKKTPAPAKAAKTTKTNKKTEKLVQGEIPDLYKIQLLRPKKEGYGVQVAFLSDYESVFRKVADLQSDWFENILVSVQGKGDAAKYKIILGPFPERKTADAYKASLAKKNKIQGFVVDLSKL